MLMGCRGEHSSWGMGRAERSSRETSVHYTAAEIGPGTLKLDLNNSSVMPTAIPRCLFCCSRKYVYIYVVKGRVPCSN